MYKLEVKLKQHTPLIHFQWQQDGATLRASEVKPKLDKFILSLLGVNKAELEGEPYREWVIIKNNYVALKYKLSIRAYGKNENIKLRTIQIPNKSVYKAVIDERGEEFPFLLCNMGGKKEVKDLYNFSLYEDIRLKFYFESETLELKIKENIARFFATTNFGQRSSKGFGSFTVVEINNEEIAWKASNYYPEGTRFMDFSLEGEKRDLYKQLILFKTVDFYWKCLKSGINYTKRNVFQGIREHKKRYIKAFLWTYLNTKSNPKNWEKRTIKRVFHLISPLLLHPLVSEDEHPAIFARALLGCPDKFEYKVPQGEIREGKESKKSYLVEINHDEKEQERKIARIPSPIYFKPVRIGDVAKVYILIDPAIKEALREQEHLRFRFDCSDQSTSLMVDIDSVDYQELIMEFHKYIGSNAEAVNSIYYQAKLPAGQSKSFHFIPRDFQWKNILGRDEEGFDRLVTLKKTGILKKI